MANMYGSTPQQQQISAAQPQYGKQMSPDWVNNFLYGLMAHHQNWEAQKNFGVKTPDAKGGENPLGWLGGMAGATGNNSPSFGG